MTLKAGDRLKVASPKPAHEVVVGRYTRLLLDAKSLIRAPGTVRISVCGRAVDHQAAMALMKRSPKITANCALAIVHSRGGIFHSFSERFKIK